MIEEEAGNRAHDHGAMVRTVTVRQTFDLTQRRDSRKKSVLLTP